MLYTTRHVARYFGVSVETVRLWSIEFAGYLSPTAQPGTNRGRQYSREDMEVLSLVARLKQENKTFEDIHASLRSGQRGQAPEIEPEQMQAITVGDYDKRLQLEIQHLTQLLASTRQELETLRSQAAEATKLREEKARLEAQLEYSERDRQRLEEQMKQLSARLEELARQAGREYARGIMDALREKGDLPRRDSNTSQE